MKKYLKRLSDAHAQIEAHTGCAGPTKRESSVFPEGNAGAESKS